jgi:hypothetical protein
MIITQNTKMLKLIFIGIPSLFSLIWFSVSLFQQKEFYLEALIPVIILGLLLPVMGYITYISILRYSTSEVETWSRKLGLNVQRWGNSSKHALREHIRSQTNKNFFGIAKKNIFFEIGPFISGQIEGRSIWVYILGNNHGEFLNYRRYTKFVCIEISCTSMPIHVEVARKYMGTKDSLDIESHNIERFFHINAPEGSASLQLLDPVMLQLMFDSNAVAIEFGGSSFVMFFNTYPIKSEFLDKGLEFGKRIAQQVDRNYPKANHA